MPRYIDADALDKRVYEEIPLKYFNGSLKTMSFVRELIEEAPTLSPDDVRGVGEWEDAKQHGLCRCSVCKDCYIEKDYITQAKWRFCPSCGARMTRAEAEKAMEVRENA